MKIAPLLLMILLAPGPVCALQQALSRVYVSMYPCARDVHGKPIEYLGQPTVTLYDRGNYGDYKYSGVLPAVTVTKSGPLESAFYFDVQPGNYEAFVKFSRSPHLFIHNGPLIVIAGYDRHLFVAGCSLTDWHSVAAVAGKMPLNDVTISVLVSDRPMQCGDDIYALDQKTLRPVKTVQRSQAVADGGAYYANFHGYGKQDRTIALEFTGALFTRGVVLVTETPDTPVGKPPFLVKDITPEIVQAATRASGTLTCVRGF